MRHLPAAAQEAQGGNYRGGGCYPRGDPRCHRDVQGPPPWKLCTERTQDRPLSSPNIQETERVGGAADRTEWKEPKRRVEQSWGKSLFENGEPNRLRAQEALRQLPGAAPRFESHLHSLLAILTLGPNSPICKIGLLYFLTKKEDKGHREGADTLPRPSGSPWAEPPSLCQQATHSCPSQQTATNPQGRENWMSE